MKLKNFLNPKYIAVLGASNDKSKVGRKILDNINILYSNKIFPINLKENKIAGLKSYKCLTDLPLKSFSELLLVVAIPAKFVLPELEKAFSLGIKNVIIVSAGFKEVGREGAQLEEKITKLAKKNKANILGPNCLGLINVCDNLNISFSDFNDDKKINKKNNIAFLSQSGAIGSAVLDWLKNKNIGLSYFVSLGNKAVLNENDFFDFFYQDKKTDLIVVYLEEISQGDRFLNIVSKLSKIKPVAVLKAGRTSFGSEMAMSHTGSLAGSNQVTITALQRSGAIILDNISQVYNLMRLIKEPLKINSNSLTIVSNAGGPTVLTADEIFENNLSLDKFSSQTIANLKRVLPSFTHVKNPLDVLGDADSERYKKSLEIILQDKKIETVLVLLTLQSMTDVENIARIISNLKNKYKDKLVCTCFLGGQGISGAKKILADNLVSNFDSPEEAISVLSKTLNYYKNRKNLKIYNHKNKKTKNLNEVLDYLKSFKLFKSYGLNVVKTKEVNYNNINKIKYPVVIKFVGPDFIHKSDKQGIFLNIKDSKSAKEVLDKLTKLKQSNKIKQNNYTIYQEMIKIDSELILGLKTDNIFGKIIMFGLGGIYTEIFKDVSFEMIDLDKKRIVQMIKSIKSYPILTGVRGKRGVDINLLADLIFNFVKIIKDNPNICEIDLNPVIISKGQAKIADIRIVY